MSEYIDLAAKEYASLDEFKTAIMDVINNNNNFNLSFDKPIKINGQEVRFQGNSSGPSLSMFYDTSAANPPFTFEEARNFSSGLNFRKYDYHVNETSYPPMNVEVLCGAAPEAATTASIMFTNGKLSSTSCNISFVQNSNERDSDIEAYRKDAANLLRKLKSNAFEFMGERESIELNFRLLDSNRNVVQQINNFAQLDLSESLYEIDKSKLVNVSSKISHELDVIVVDSYAIMPPASVLAGEQVAAPKGQSK